MHHALYWMVRIQLAFCEPPACCTAVTVAATAGLEHDLCSFPAGSKVAAIVACSYGSSAKECAGLEGCTWSEGTCYPKFYAPIISKPKTLAAFKRQVMGGYRVHIAIVVGREQQQQRAAAAS